MIKALHVRNDQITVGAQIDIEGDQLAREDAFYVEYPNNSRAGGKVIGADEKGATIEVGNQQFRVRRTTAADNPMPTGSDLLTSWIVTELL